MANPASHRPEPSFSPTRMVNSLCPGGVLLRPVRVVITADGEPQARFGRLLRSGQRFAPPGHCPPGTRIPWRGSQVCDKRSNRSVAKGPGLKCPQGARSLTLGENGWSVPWSEHSIPTNEWSIPHTWHGIVWSGHSIVPNAWGVPWNGHSILWNG